VAARWRWRGAAFAAEREELVSEIVTVAGRKRLLKEFIEDGQKIRQGADWGQRRGVGSAEAATCGGQPQSVFDQSQGDATIIKLGG
jgi:hypothetical protein